MENVVAILEVLVLHDVEQVSRLTADGSYRGFMTRREPRCQSSTLGIEAGVRTRGNTALMLVMERNMCQGAHLLAKKQREDSESFKYRKNKVFYVIFSVLMYFLWDISTWDAFLARDSGSPSLSFWPCYVLKIREFAAFSGMLMYVSSPAITLSAFAKACTPN